MSTSRRSATTKFSIGGFSVQVSATRRGLGTPSISESALDQLMVTLSTAVNEVISSVSTHLSGLELSEGEVKHTTSRTIAIDGTALRTEATLELDRKVPELILAIVVNKILDRLTNITILALSSAEISQLIEKLLTALREEFFNFLANQVPDLISSFGFSPEENVES